MKKNNTNFFQLVLVGFILLVVLTICIKSTFDSYYEFYYPDKNYKAPYLYRMTDEIAESKPVRVFCSYTGFDTGYGFYAPNVASSFVLVSKIYDDQGQLLKEVNNLNFKAKESHVRFFSFQTMFLEKLDKKTDQKYNAYLDIIIKQIAGYILSQFPKGDAINTKLYLYDYPRINEVKKGEIRPKIIEIKDYDIAR